MFGYITINKPELKVKEYDYYRSCYCGLCHTLKKEHGFFAPITLTYDMTFLSILLTALYEQKYKSSKHRCVASPIKTQPMRENEITKYCADMTLLLSYHNLMDDWKDDKNLVKLSMAVGIKKEYLKICKKYKRQSDAVEKYMIELNKCEKEDNSNLDMASGLTGDLFKEIFIYKEDHWKEVLGNLGFYIGKFIYLIDAYDDVYEDIKHESYNPFSKIANDEDFEKRADIILNLIGSSAAREFERLPILVNSGILRNIIYSGIWMKYAIIKKKRIEESKEDKGKGNK